MPYSNKHPVSCPHIALNYSVWFAILAAWLLIIVECGSIADGLFVLTRMHVCACVRVCVCACVRTRAPLCVLMQAQAGFAEGMCGDVSSEAHVTSKWKWTTCSYCKCAVYS